MEVAPKIMYKYYVQVTSGRRFQSRTQYQRQRSDSPKTGGTIQPPSQRPRHTYKYAVASSPTSPYYYGSVQRCRGINLHCGQDLLRQGALLSNYLITSVSLFYSHFHDYIFRAHLLFFLFFLPIFDIYVLLSLNNFWVLSSCHHNHQILFRKIQFLQRGRTIGHNQWSWAMERRDDKVAEVLKKS